MQRLEGLFLKSLLQTYFSRVTRRDHLFSLVVGLQNSVSVQRHMDFNLLECARAENTGNFVFVDRLSGPV
jgi:hypothetical protein